MRGHMETMGRRACLPSQWSWHLGGAVRLAEHLVPRRKFPLKSDSFSALFRASRPDSSLYSASCGPHGSPSGYKAVDAGPALLKCEVEGSLGDHLVPRLDEKQGSGSS